MARRSKAQDKAFGALILMALVIGTPIYIVMKIGESTGWPVLTGGSVAFVAAYFWYVSARQNAKEKTKREQIDTRKNQLLSKYGDERIVGRIMDREIWQGQSQEQLIDSLGAPVDTDEKVMKKSRREVWKYNQWARIDLDCALRLRMGWL